MNRFFRYWAKAAPTSLVPAVPDGFRIYAIGDVHGRDDLLEMLLGQIEANLTRTTASKTVLVFLGDLIDRGPNSAKVISRVMQYRHQGRKCVFLLGNHEEALLRILNGEPGHLPDWLRFGGAAFAKSYGVSPDELQNLAPAQAARRLRSVIPRAHISFLKSFSDSFRAGDYFFAHAGVRPGRPLEQQTSADLRWIRSPFLEHHEPLEAMIVHGHTISEEVDRRPHRIGIDTGAYKTGVLTAIGLQDVEQWTLQAKLPPDDGQFIV